MKILDYLDMEEAHEYERKRAMAESANTNCGKTLTAIAVQYLGVKTLQERGFAHLDSYIIPVVSLAHALEAAYEAGASDFERFSKGTWKESPTSLEKLIGQDLSDIQKRIMEALSVYEFCEVTARSCFSLHHFITAVCYELGDAFDIRSRLDAQRCIRSLFTDGYISWIPEGGRNGAAGKETDFMLTNKGIEFMRSRNLLKE